MVQSRSVSAGSGGTVLRRLLTDPLGCFGLVLVVALVVAAIGADWLSPWTPTALNVRQRLLPPDMTHLLGTDHLGRDILSRVLHGGRIALYVSIVSVSAALTLGCVLGMIAGYGPRWLENALILVFDAVRSFPTVLFALAVVTLVGPSLTTIMLIVVVTTTPIYGRIVRVQTLSLKAQEFVLAERAMGAGPIRVLAHHVLPNLIGPLLILASMEVPVVITIESGLSFLGLGVRPPTPSWGSILNDGYNFIRDTPWPVIAGGVPIVLTTLGFTFLGEALRDIFDPRLQREP
ncbi:MAG: ABC transporter permease [Alphaproteobacteria bacterium]|nr:ABC transporter permease [Alphaproteobacteria bacterium]